MPWKLSSASTFFFQKSMVRSCLFFTLSSAEVRKMSTSLFSESSSDSRR